jgi:hypothetical protein
MSLPLSEGVERILACLHCQGRPRGNARFPKNYDLTKGRVEPGESLRDWFKRCVDDALNGEIELCRVEDNLALFLSLAWEGGDELTFIHCQALALNDGADLHTFYDNGSGDAQYLRLEFNHKELGPVYSHPLPHIHGRPDGAPRFPMETSQSGNALIDFLDFLYRNFSHAVWLRWAQKTWSAELKRRNLGEDTFTAIQESFKAGQADLLVTNYREHLVWMKKAWRDEKDGMFPLRISSNFRDLLSYTI